MHHGPSSWAISLCWLALSSEKELLIVNGYCFSNKGTLVRFSVPCEGETRYKSRQATTIARNHYCLVYRFVSLLTSGPSSLVNPYPQVGLPIYLQNAESPIVPHHRAGPRTGDFCTRKLCNLLASRIRAGKSLLLMQDHVLSCLHRRMDKSSRNLPHMPTTIRCEADHDAD